MQDIPLTYYKRVILWNIVGNHQVASLKEASVCLRLIEKLRLSDEEARDSKFRQTPIGFEWSLPGDNFGNRMVGLEQDEAAALTAAIEAHQPVRVSDAVWMLPLTEQLKEPQLKGEPAYAT